jgi:hypothetical protein
MFSRKLMVINPFFGVAGASLVSAFLATPPPAKMNEKIQLNEKTSRAIEFTTTRETPVTVIDSIRFLDKRTCHL